MHQASQHQPLVVVACLQQSTFPASPAPPAAFVLALPHPQVLLLLLLLLAPVAQLA
jgi:hypothetical protein